MRPANRLSTWLMLGVAVFIVAIATTYALRRDQATPRLRIAPQDAAAPAPSGATLDITYIANEGVLIAGGGKQVLIDGLHREYRPSYPFLPSPHREQLETAQAPFHKIDVILVSHFHLDHFHAVATAEHLRHNPKAVLVSSQQVVEGVRSEASDYDRLSARITAATPAVGQTMAVTAGGVEIELLGLGHGSGRNSTVQNLGHLVRLAGKRVLHLGDAEADPAIFGAFRLHEQGIDVAFVPVWFLMSDEGAKVVRDQIKPKQIFAVHMPARDPEQAIARMSERFPEAVPLVVLLEKRYY